MYYDEPALLDARQARVLVHDCGRELGAFLDQYHKAIEADAGKKERSNRDRERLVAEHLKCGDMVNVLPEQSRERVSRMIERTRFHLERCPPLEIFEASVHDISARASVAEVRGY